MSNLRFEKLGRIYVVLLSIAATELTVSAATPRPADFNGDGFGDLAISAPGESIGNVRAAGAVHILYGSANGVTSTANQLWSQDTADIGDQADANDRFGQVLAIGDFNGDGYSDLAIGVPFEDVDSTFGRTDSDAGVVHILYGSPTGLSATGTQRWSQDSSGIPGETEDNDVFGLGLAAGDFNADGVDDLAITAPGEDNKNPNCVFPLLTPFSCAIKGSMGRVHILYGTTFAGLTSTGNQNINLENTKYGRAVTAGDFKR